MKRTGRTLTLTNDLISVPAVNTIEAGGARLTTIFEDDREGYAWRIVDINEFNLWFQTFTQGWALMTTRPDSFVSTTEYQTWAFNRALFSNQLIGTIMQDLAVGSRYVSLKADHMAVNHLSLLYNDRELPTYNITLEEYTISDREEIAYKIKETSQSLNQIGEQ